MWELKQTSQFKKDLKRWERKPQKMKNLLKVLEQLAGNGAVDESYGPHPLKGDYAGTLECHIENDFLLIWLDESEKTIKLVRLGTHSELFKK